MRREVNLTWMPLTPTGLLESLYADPARLAAVTPELDDDQRASLRRERGEPWTVSDVPLLDEAAELLGDDDTGGYEARRLAAQQRQAEVEYARGASADLRGSRWSGQRRDVGAAVRRRRVDR